MGCCFTPEVAELPRRARAGEETNSGVLTALGISEQRQSHTKQTREGNI